MNRSLLSICFLILAGGLFAQVAPPAVYVLYNSQNMDILDYRMAYGGNSATAYYAYTFKPGTNDQYVMYTGNGVYADYLPTGTQLSRDFKMGDDLVSGVNAVTRQLFVVQQQQRGYVVSPVVSVTKITKSNNYYIVNAAAYSFILDGDNVMMGRELAVAGSRSSVTLSTFGYNNCKYQYSFRRTPNTAGAESAEFDFIPGIGITAERSGRNAAEMQANQVNLWGINGFPLTDYISRECGNTGAPKTTPPPPTANNVTQPEPRLGDPGTGDPQPIGSNVMISAISNHPVVNCNKQAAPGYHIVQPKETLNSIARFYGVTPAQLKTWNGIKDANKISVCQELRIAAVAATPKSPVQQAKGTPTPIGPAAPKVTPPPAAPAVQPNYQPVQPTPQSSLPNLFDPGTAPATYSSPQPSVPVPAAAAPAATTPSGNLGYATGQYYSVQPGEGIYTIAKKFGYTDERFRSMNAFPATGNVPLQVGQLVRVSDCEHTPVQTYSTLEVKPAVPTARPGATVAPAGVATTPALTQPAAPGFQPLAPVTSSTTTPGLTNPNGGTPGFVPLGGSPATQPAVTVPDPVKPVTKKEPIGFKDYFVRDSETIKDIARKQQLDPSELALINGKDQNEVLPPGTRIQLPIY